MKKEIVGEMGQSRQTKLNVRLGRKFLEEVSEVVSLGVITGVITDQEPSCANTFTEDCLMSWQFQGKKFEK